MQQKLFLPCGRSVCGSAKAGRAGSGISTYSGELCMEALFEKKYKQKKKKSKPSKGWNESMSALWLFPLPSQLLSELSQPWLLEVPAGQEQCPKSWCGAQGPSGISVQALQPGLPWRGCWRWALEQPGFAGSWISFLVQSPCTEGSGRRAQVPAVCGCGCPRGFPVAQQTLQSCAEMFKYLILSDLNYLFTFF